MKYIFSFLTLVLLSSTALFSQSTVVPLWDSPIPGAIQSPAYREDTLRPGKRQIRIYRVSIPTLEIYPAPKTNANGTAVIIAPGGGYVCLATDIEGSAIAQWLNSLGITAVVLKYRLPNDSIMVKKEVGPLQDAQEAVRKVRRLAKELNIDPGKIGFMGFSAGGHLAATISTHYADNVYQSDGISARPDFTVLGYPVISMESINTHTGSRMNLLGSQPAKETIEFFSAEKQVTADTPPAFIFQAENDKAVPVMNSILFFQALLDKNVPAELHLFQSGGHGFGLGKGGTESAWTELCARWLSARGFIK